MAKLDKIEFEQFGPYRFIGKSVYARAGVEHSGIIFGTMWGISKPIFDTLDSLKDYATKETHNVALLTFDKYDEQKKLLGYTVGKFMKADTPVPDGMDYFDIPAIHMAKGWVSGEFDDMIANAEGLTAEAVKQHGKYEATWEFLAEVYTPDTHPTEGEHSVLGYYISCKENI